MTLKMVVPTLGRREVRVGVMGARGYVSKLCRSAVAMRCNDGGRGLVLQRLLCRFEACVLNVFGCEARIFLAGKPNASLWGAGCLGILRRSRRSPKGGGHGAKYPGNLRPALTNCAWFSSV